MADFDRLNRETREYNSRVHYENTKYGTSEYWRNYYNNQTYRENNGQYSKHYYWCGGVLKWNLLMKSKV